MTKAEQQHRAAFIRATAQRILAASWSAPDIEVAAPGIAIAHAESLWDELAKRKLTPGTLPDEDDE